MRLLTIGSTRVYIAPLSPDNVERLLAAATPAALAAVEPVKSLGRRAEILTTWAMVAEIFSRDAVIGHAPSGAPFIQGSPAHISISHCADCVVIAVDDCRVVGIDAEVWRPQLLRVACKFLTPAEAARTTSHLDLLCAWTIKEAVYKAAMIPGLSLCDILLPERGSNVAKVVGAAGRSFNVVTVELSPCRAITLVTL